MGITIFPFDFPRTPLMNSVLEYFVPVRDFFFQVALLYTCLNPILLLLLSFDVREYISSCCVWILQQILKVYAKN